MTFLYLEWLFSTHAPSSPTGCLCRAYGEYRWVFRNSQGILGTGWISVWRFSSVKEKKTACPLSNMTFYKTTVMIKLAWILVQLRITQDQNILKLDATSLMTLSNSNNCFRCVSDAVYRQLFTSCDTRQTSRVYNSQEDQGTSRDNIFRRWAWSGTFNLWRLRPFHSFMSDRALARTAKYVGSKYTWH